MWFPDCGVRGHGRAVFIVTPSNAEFGVILGRVRFCNKGFSCFSALTFPFKDPEHLIVLTWHVQISVGLCLLLNPRDMRR